jgi:type IV fimbrial biogenesis protein FimT
MPVSVNTNRLSPANIFLLLRCYKYTMKNYKLALGFTLIELLIVVSIVAILVTVAAPSFVQQMDDSKAYGVRDKLTDILAYARSEAVSRRENITVCASNDGVNCSGNVADWNAWWLVRDTLPATLKIVDISNSAVAVAVNQPINTVCFDAFGVTAAAACGGIPAIVGQLTYTITPPGTGIRPSVLALIPSGMVLHL